MKTTEADFWVKTNWTLDSLRDKRVQFELNYPEIRVSGIGFFLAGQRPTGELQIEIVVRVVRSLSEGDQYNFKLRQVDVDRIQRHPDRSVAEFQLLA